MLNDMIHWRTVYANECNLYLSIGKHWSNQIGHCVTVCGQSNGNSTSNNNIVGWAVGLNGFEHSMFPWSGVV